MTVTDRITRAAVWCALLLNLHWWLQRRWSDRLDREIHWLCTTGRER